jgi:hypothetical protein
MQVHKVPRSPVRGSAAQLVAGRFRQIHLDFHTSEHIPDVGAGFDPDAFAETLSAARVNWITLFGKCHHGLSYYPTRAGTVHPSLRFDLLGRQIEACRRRGIVTPVYLSVRVDEHHARRDPGWIARLKDGKLWKWGDTLTPAWYQHCLNNPAYVEELAAQAVEVLKWYDAEGLFFDMCYCPDPGCYCPRCYDGMRRLGLDFASDDDHRRFEYLVTRDYTRRLARAVRGVRRNATLFFNGRMRPDIAGELDVFSHLEIEALPTGGWGYAFFPIHARYARVHPRPVQGMTARFHKSWADFGGLKSKDQMLYEAGTILAAGAVMNVGDQCHPRGTLDRGAYEVIGEAFRHVERCEPWCVGARAAAEVGVMMLPPAPGADGAAASPAGAARLSPAADGAGRMLLELHHQFNLIYPDTDLAPYRAVILPDTGWIGPDLRRSLAAFLRGGGAILASHEAGLADGVFTCPGLPGRYAGAFPSKPCYLHLGRELGRGLPDSRYVFYEDSAQVRPAAGAARLGRLCTSYFNRSYDRFCSHNQTPDDRPTSWPVAVVRGRVGYLAPAVFRAYREHAYALYKELAGRVLDRLLPEPLVRADAPSAMEVSVNRQSRPRRLVVHLVNFQPQRRHRDVEWIEQIYPVRDLPLAVRTERRPRAVYLAPSRLPLPFDMHGAYCTVTVPEVHAHQMVVFEG